MKWLVLLLLAGFIGCESVPQYVEPTDSDRSVILNGMSYDAAFNQVKAAFFYLHYEITAGSKESGFLNGQKQRDIEKQPLLFGISGYDQCKVSFIEKGGTVTISVRISVAFSDGTIGDLGKSFYDEFWTAFKTAGS